MYNCVKPHLDRWSYWSNVYKLFPPIPIKNYVSWRNKLDDVAYNLCLNHTRFIVEDVDKASPFIER